MLKRNAVNVSRTKIEVTFFQVKIKTQNFKLIYVLPFEYFINLGQICVKFAHFLTNIQLELLSIGVKRFLSLGSF